MPKKHLYKHVHTCLQHLLKAEEGMLAGAIWSKVPPVTLKSGMATMNTATETSPRHKTSAFSTLEMRIKHP